MSESTELMVGAAVLVVLIIVIYLIWKWYQTPAAAAPAAGSMANAASRALVIRGGSNTTDSDNVNFQNSTLVKSVDDILAHGYQHKYGSHPPRPHDAPGVDLEYKDLVTAGVFDPDMTVDQLDGLGAEDRPSGQHPHYHRLMNIQQEMNDHSKNVTNLLNVVKQGNVSPAVRMAADKVDASSKSVKNTIANATK